MTNKFLHCIKSKLKDTGALFNEIYKAVIFRSFVTSLA